MVHVADLALSQFRSHRRARLTFDGRPAAFYGPNGAGKTNLIEAVSLLSPGQGLRRAAAEEIARRPDPVGWKVTAVVQGPAGLREVETWAEPGEGRQVRIDGKAAPQLALAAVLPVVWLVPAMDRLWIEAPEGRRRFLDRITLSLMPDHAGLVLDYDRAMRERNRLLKDMVRDAHWYAALEQRMADTGAAITWNRRQAVARLMAVRQDGPFPAAELTLTHPDDALPETAEALRAALSDSRGRDMAAGRALIGPHRADLRAVWAAKGMEAAACSTGEQKALLISLVLANARVLAAEDRPPPVILLDEVAAHLDAGRRAALYDAICDLGAQAFLTGTGPEQFAELGTRAQLWEVTEDAGTSALFERTPP